MKSFKKTYRFLSALTLIALASSILLPAGIAAANLDCDMEITESNHSCSFTTNGYEYKINEVDEDCTLQTFCEGTVDNNPSDVPAVTQSSKILIAVAFTDVLDFTSENNDQPKIFQDESTSLHHFVPLFLLNSVFLN